MDEKISTTASKDTELSAYLGHIHYKDVDGRDVIARGAVWCESREGFDAALEAHLSDQGASFLWSEEVHAATDWFKKHGSHGLMAGLARKVDGMAPVALSDPKAAHDEAPENESYLIIEEIEGVEPLDMQMGVYPKLTVPAPLQEAMFDQPEPTEAEIEAAGGNPENVPPMGTYAILDAAKMPYLLTGELEFSGLEYQSLFQGAVQEELGEHAPYIVRLEDGNDFTRKLFTGLKPPLGLWEKEFGIFIRSRASLVELRKHFRKFTRVQDEQGKWYYFRFWEGKYLSKYNQAIQDSIERVNRWYLIPNFSINVLIFDQSRKVLEVTSPKPSLKYKQPNQGFVVTEIETQSFTETSGEIFVEKLIEYLIVKNEKFAAIEIDRQRTLITTIVSSANKYGIDIEHAIADYAEASLLFERPVDQDMLIKKILTSEHHALDKGKMVLQDVKKQLGIQEG